MNKIAVGRAIAQAYGFALGQLATIIGLIWLPLAILLGGEYFAIRRYLASVLTALVNGDRYAVFGAAGYLYAFWLAAVLLQAMILVPVLRQALGLRDKGAFVHIALGAAELRMFGAVIAFDLIAGTLLVIVFLSWVGLMVGLSYAAQAEGFGQALADLRVWSGYAFQLLLWALYIGLYVRLWFLLAPIVVAERRIDLVRSWTLSAGNFWRALVVLGCVTVPVWSLYLAVQFGFAGHALVGEATGVLPFASRFSSSPELASAQIQATLAWLPSLFGAWLLVRPLALGLSSGAAAAAYRALVREDEALSTAPTDEPLAAAS